VARQRKSEDAAPKEIHVPVEVERVEGVIDLSDALVHLHETAKAHAAREGARTGGKDAARRLENVGRLARELADELRAVGPPPDTPE
jgi:hypothetical protein